MKATLELPACTCREVSVQDVDFTLDETAIQSHLVGKEGYRRTDFVVLRSGDDVAITAVKRAEPGALFSPITEVRVLALPSETAWVDDPAADVMNASHLARAARTGGRRAAVVKGQFEHVNFVLGARAMPLRVFDVVPPAPTKLGDMVRQVVDYADLPPIELQQQAFDLHQLLVGKEFAAVLTPCRVPGFNVEAPTLSLDQRPPAQEVEGALLLGCKRSLEIYQHFYGTQPEWVNICPRDLAPQDGTPTILKCCLYEFDYEIEGDHLTVPWGSTLRQLEAALERFTAERSGDTIPQASKL